MDHSELIRAFLDHPPPFAENRNIMSSATLIVVVSVLLSNFKVVSPCTPVRNAL